MTPSRLVDRSGKFDNTNFLFDHGTPTNFYLADARQKRPQVAAKTQRNHREPNNEHGDGHSGDAELFPHSTRLVANEGTAAPIRAYNWV